MSNMLQINSFFFSSEKDLLWVDWGAWEEALIVALLSEGPVFDLREAGDQSSYSLLQKWNYY